MSAFEFLGGLTRPNPNGTVGVVIEDIFSFSNKKVNKNKVTLVCEPLDAWGDAVGKAVPVKLTQIDYFGPTGPTVVLAYQEGIWHAPTAQKIHVIKAYVVYEDGSEEIINGEDIKHIYENDSVWNARKKEEADRKEEEERKKTQAEIAAEIAKEGDRKKRGIVCFAGKVDGYDFSNRPCKIKKIGNDTFYISDTTLIGWESTKNITCLDMPSLGVRYVHKQCHSSMSNMSVKLPVERKYYFIADRLDLWVGPQKAKRVIIPKEARLFCAKIYGLQDIEEIEFEDPCGWGVRKKIITDPQKMRELIRKVGSVELRKTFINKIIYKLGL